MKHWLTILLLLGVVKLANAQTALPPSHPASEHVLGAQADIPHLVLPRTLLPPLTDSAYLISPARFRFYQQLHRHVLDATAGAGDPLIISYAQSLQATQRTYDTLLVRYRASNQLSAQTLRRTQLALGQLGRSLDQAQYALAQTARSLEEAKAQARAARRRSLVQRVAYGAGGLGAGLLIGLLLR
jgi:hypothetical protein